MNEIDVINGRWQKLKCESQAFDADVSCLCRKRQAQKVPNERKIKKDKIDKNCGNESFEHYSEVRTVAVCSKERTPNFVTNLIVSISGVLLTVK